MNYIVSRFLSITLISPSIHTNSLLLKFNIFNLLLYLNTLSISFINTELQFILTPYIYSKYLLIKFDFITFYAAFLVWNDVKFVYVNITALKY